MTRERRFFSRVPHAFEVKYRLDELGAPWRAVTTINLSASGMRFRTEEPLEQGTALELQMTLTGIREVLIVRGHVVWSQMQASGVTENGVAFMDVKPEQQIQIDSLVGFLKKSE